MTVKELINELSKMNSDSEVELVVSDTINDYVNVVKCVMVDPEDENKVLILSPVY